MNEDAPAPLVVAMLAALVRSAGEVVRPISPHSWLIERAAWYVPERTLLALERHADDLPAGAVTGGATKDNPTRLHGVVVRRASWTTEPFTCRLTIDV